MQRMDSSKSALKGIPLRRGDDKDLHDAASGLQSHGMKEVSVAGRMAPIRFRVPEAWNLIESLGSGAYGTVAAFRASGREFAVKKVERVLDEPLVALRTLREIRLLSQLCHPNVLSIQDVFVEGPSFQDAYICLELMDSDLAHLICPSRELLADQQVRSILHQVLCGLLCLHSARVIHRDLKPGNILVKVSGDVKIGDLGLARSIDIVPEDLGSGDLELLTEYVVTRHYRAPEVVLTPMQYTYAVDIWSVGCIFGEIWERKPMFKGKDSLDQIRKIVVAMGRISADDTSWISRRSAGWKFMERCTQSPRRADFCWPDMEPVAADLLVQLLRFNPARRLTAEQALHHAYFEENGICAADRDEVAAAQATAPVDWTFDRELCYNEDGQPRRFDCNRFRAAMMSAFADAAAVSGGQKSNSRGRHVPAYREQEQRQCAPKENIAAHSNVVDRENHQSRVSGAAHIRGGPIAAVRKRMSL